MAKGTERTAVDTGKLKRILAAVIAAAAVLLAFEVMVIHRDVLRAETAQSSIAEAADRCSAVSDEIKRLEYDIEIYSDLPAAIEGVRDEFFRNASELERRVQSGETGVKIAYLTFDDGPYDLTRGYLEVLAKYEVLATFFQRGRDWDRFGEIYRLVYAGCHTMGNHTYSHKIRRGIYTSVDAFMDDLLKNREYLQEKLGVTTEVMRFPGGSNTAGKYKQGIIARLKDEHYAYVDWNGATGDGMYDLTADEYRDNVLNRTGDKLLVVLMHDYNSNTLAALPEIIEGLRTRGYVFLPLFYESLAVNR